MSNNHQGKFHLIILFSIPIAMGAIFFMKDWWSLLLVFGFLALVAYLVFKKL